MSSSKLSAPQYISYMVDTLTWISLIAWLFFEDESGVAKGLFLVLYLGAFIITVVATIGTYLYIRRRRREGPYSPVLNTRDSVITLVSLMAMMSVLFCHGHPALACVGLVALVINAALFNMFHAR